MKKHEVDAGRVREMIRDFLRGREEIVFVYLHGTFVTGAEFRDVDVAVYLKKGAAASPDGLDYEISLSLRLEEMTGLPIDVKILNGAPLAFRYHVTLGELLLTRDEAVREDFLTRTWSEYFDFLPTSRLYQRERKISATSPSI